MSQSIRRTRRTAMKVSSTLCAAWLIAAAGASESLAQQSAGASSSTTAAPSSPASTPQGNGGSSSDSKGGKTYSGAAKATSPAAAAARLLGIPGAGSPKSGPPSGAPGGPDSAMAGERNPFDTTAANSSVTVSEYLTVDLHVQDEDLANVLQMLSLQSQRNIVVSKDVSATVSANLYNVTFYEALDAILNVNGYGYLERGNFIFVYTLEELAQIEQAQRKPVSKVVKLNYLNANDAAEFVAPLLSEVGQIKTNGDVPSYSVPDKSPVGDEQFALAATMVVFDYPEHIDEIEKLIAQLDTRPLQVLVEATILQTSLNEANAFGVDFSIIGDVDFIDFLNTGGPLSVANALVKGGDGSDGAGLSPEDNVAQGLTSSPGNTTGPSTFKLGIIDDDFSVFMRLLDEVTDVSILSNPKVLTLNRQPARVLVGQRLGYLNTTSTETSTTQTVEFLDTGTQLAFRPFISSDGMIRMELSPSVSEGVIRQSTNTTGANVSIPDEITQELTTNVIVRDGSTIVLGGLFKETTTLGRRQVPVVGDIPIIGLAFRGHEDSTKRSEIIFLIKPTIISDQKLVDDGIRAMAYGERIRVGSRNGLLPFSQDRMTAQRNVEAEKLAQEGKTEEALWKVRRSLELKPNQPDAIELREALLNERERWPSRSLLERIVDDEVERKYQSFQPLSDADEAKPAEAPAETTAVDADEGSDQAASAADPGEMGPFMPTDQPYSGEFVATWGEESAPAWTQAEGQSVLFDPYAAGTSNSVPLPDDSSVWALPFRMGDLKLMALADEGAEQQFESGQTQPAYSALWRAMLGLPVEPTDAETGVQPQDPTLTDAEDESPDEDDDY